MSNDDTSRSNDSGSGDSGLNNPETRESNQDPNTLGQGEPDPAQFVQAPYQNEPNRTEPPFYGNIDYINPIDLRKARHPAEKPLFVISVMITVFTVFSILMNSLAGGTSSIGGLDGMPTTTYIIITAVYLLLLLYSMYAQKRAFAVRVSEKNFPEIFHKSVAYARKLGLEKIPEIYIEQQNGILNAFASAVIGKRYVGLNAEIVDIAYMEHQDFEPVFYVLAHELAHHYYRHTSIKYILLSYVGLIIPVFGQALSRAREYSCDRVAQLLVDRDCVREAMILSAGRHLYPYVDLDDYLQNARREGGFFLWLTNLMSTHPIALKRIAALADPLRKGGKLF